MRRPLRWLRLTALPAAVVLMAALLPSAAHAAYEPPAWDPPADQNVTTVRWGPIPIPAAQSDDMPGEVVNQVAVNGPCNPLIGLFTSCRTLNITKPCEDCYLTGIMPDLVFAGTDTGVNMMTGGMLHHVVLVNFSRPDSTCPPGLTKRINQLGLIQGGNERFFAAGNERTLNRLYAAGNYGYQVKSGDRWGLIYHLMNMNPEPISVEFKFTFSWTRSATKVDPIWLDVDQCDDSERPIPAGYSDLHWSTTVLRSGTLVAVGGHAHDYSIAVSLENVTRRRYSCVSVSGYAPDSMFAPAGPGPGTAGHPASANTVTSTGHPNATLDEYMGSVSDFSSCQPDLTFGFLDQIRVHATYNHPTGDDGAMGIMVAYVR
ncbi:hypothetical protein [Nonomuraea sp. NPDC049695]|uniref:hypothetical protein n=1 Tax=Nonomuraea sp. NPDC049695 TaxID=3154734 RepID=UPI003431F7A8